VVVVVVVVVVVLLFVEMVESGMGKAEK